MMFRCGLHEQRLKWQRGVELQPEYTPDSDQRVHAMMTSSGALGLHKYLTGASGAREETRKASQMLITFVSWLTALMLLQCKHCSQHRWVTVTSSLSPVM